MERAEFLSACKTFLEALTQATNSGLLDELQCEMSGPDVINQVCDGVSELSGLK